MNSFQIDKILRSNIHTKYFYGGVLAYDQISYIYYLPNQPIVFVLNTATTNTPGEHWILVILSNKICELFDSLALPIEAYKELIEKLSKICNSIKITPYRIQNIYTPSCGYHCILFFLLRTQFKANYIFKNIYFAGKYSDNDILAISCITNWFPQFF